MSDMTFRSVPLEGKPITLTLEFTDEEWAASMKGDPKVQSNIEAEMAACPYVACTCGWHGED